MEITFVISGFVFGLISSLHCVGMCGPIALALGINAQNKLKFSLKNLTYQLGRVSTYVILGLILGLIGEGFSFAGIQKIISIILGIAMILIVLIPRIFKSKANWDPMQGVLLKVKIALGKRLKKQGWSSLYVIGLLNGLLPCGMVYMALTSAIAIGSIYNSLFFMLFFGLGTIPLMFSSVLLGNFLSIEKRQMVLKLIPIFTLFLGILFILRGLSLGIPYVSPAKESLQLHSEENCHDPMHHH